MFSSVCGRFLYSFKSPTSLCFLTPGRKVMGLHILVTSLFDLIWSHPLRDFGGKLFKMDGSQGNFEASKATCFQAGGQLASPQSMEENTAIQQIVARHNKAAYLGMDDIQAEGTFAYLSGDPIGYTNWANGEPNNAGSKENCIEMYLDGKWNDRSFFISLRRFAICSLKGNRKIMLNKQT
uniref:C-type lectin domain-containing protein n=1 Tax=Varanus komodoensis TaxID=61221 RepID=A0A8D2JET0_VARKO